MQRGILTPFLILLIGGCSAANATQFDSANDVHCSILANSIRIMGDQQRAPADQTKAAAFVDEWYGRKLFELAQSRGEKEVLAEAEAIVKVVEKDPAGFKDEYMSCAERALKDAGLNSQR